MFQLKNIQKNLKIQRVIKFDCQKAKKHIQIILFALANFDKKAQKWKKTKKKSGNLYARSTVI